MTPRELGLPQNTIIIGGKVYTFECEERLKDEEGDHCLGMTSVVRQLIKLSGGSGLHTLKDTVLHEAIHAIDYNNKMNLTEEQVHVLAGAILDFLWSNPNMAYWLSQHNVVLKPTEQAGKKKPAKKPAVPKNKKVKKNPMGFISEQPASAKSKRPKQTEKKAEVLEQSQSQLELVSFDPPEAL